ncbi:MAG: DTW domain-containing protein [Planctomycetes bacterium]|nr:DTW domain-containing protein [Planctomycetota bacterium]
MPVDAPAMLYIDPRKSRCNACKQAVAACLCAALPRVALPLRVIVLQHWRERNSQSNTGTLVSRVLAGSEVARVGCPGAPIDPSLLSDPATDYRVLFPFAGAPVVSPEDGAQRPARRTALVVLDATWPQARRMWRRVPGLRGLRFVRLPEDAVPLWRLREPPRPGRLSTIEAVALALEMMGHPGGAGALRAALGIVAPRILAVRGRRAHPAGPRLGGCA